MLNLAPCPRETTFSFLAQPIDLTLNSQDLHNKLNKSAPFRFNATCNGSSPKFPIL